MLQTAKVFGSRSRWVRAGLFACALGSCVLAKGSAWAQGAVQPAEPVAPNGGAEPSTTPLTAPAPAPEPAAQPEAVPSTVAVSSSPAPICFPACRSGFVCGSGGACISACNPPCAAGERCTASGDCEHDAARAPTTNAPVAAPEQGVETHDGIMLRFTVGLGGGGMRETFDDPRPGIAKERTAVGASLMGSVDVGGALTDELTLHGRISLLVIASPDLETDGRDVDLPYHVNVMSVLLGPALTYNFMPLNLYLTGAVGLHVLSFAYDEEDEDFDEDFRDHPIAGVGLNFDIGKEWWVTTQTGLGVAARFSWGTGGGEYELLGLRDSSRNLIAFGLLFSVTHQ